MQWMTPRADETVRRSIEAVWRIESARLIGGLVRFVRDLDLAEDLAQQALLSALQAWPQTGVPNNPGAWLMTTAKRLAIDGSRHQRIVDGKHEQLARELVPTVSDAVDAALIDVVEDDVLRLMLIAAHPVLSREARVALVLRLLCGLTTDEIARAFLVAEATMAQRIVRAKRTLSEARVPFEVPRGVELTERVGAVLEAIYLVFNEGYSSTRGEDWVRPALCDEGLRLGRMLAALVPDDPEAFGLLALMELQASRLKARSGPNGEIVTLLEQNRAHWDYLMIGRGLAALERADRLGGARGPYVLQAAIAACHARARQASDTDWERIVALYDALAQLLGSPVVFLNRAVAVSMAYGPAQGLELVEELQAEPALRSYHHLPSVRGDLLFRLERFEEARVEFERAATLTRNQTEQALLTSRANACRDKLSSSGVLGTDPTDDQS